jgi:tetratricopeptide (TPR) repeat protein
MNGSDVLKGWAVPMLEMKRCVGRIPMVGAMFVTCLLVPGLNLSSHGNAETQASAPRGRFEVTSGLDRKLYALPDNAAISMARGNLAKDPHNVTLILELSKAQAGQRQYREAVETCTKGIAFAPSNADLYIERGHRELGLRRFRAGMIDLEHAVSLDPKKLDANYHLAMSHYFVGEFDEAAHYFQSALDLAPNSDSVIDCTNWLYVSLRRAGKDEQAAQVLKRIAPEMKNTEPHLYFYLRLLRFYQGGITAQAVIPPKPTDPADLEKELSFDTTSYGIGNWDFYHHEVPQAKELFQSVVTGQAWNAWGFIGSETELIRMRKEKAAAVL